MLLSQTSPGAVRLGQVAGEGCNYWAQRVVYWCYEPTVSVVRFEYGGETDIQSETVVDIDADKVGSVIRLLGSPHSAMRHSRGMVHSAWK